MKTKIEHGCPALQCGVERLGLTIRRGYVIKMGLFKKSALDWLKEGYSLDGDGKHEEATKCFDKALEIDPEDPEIWQSKGFALISLGRYEEAMECCSIPAHYYIKQ